MPYFKQSDSFIVPTTDGKLMEEHFANATTSNKNISIANMIASLSWSEPFQNPEFDEYTLVSSGKTVEVDGRKNYYRSMPKYFGEKTQLCTLLQFIWRSF
jgi:hypothetical protein